MDLSERFWLKSYPQGVPPEVDPSRYSSVLELLEEAFTRFGTRTAYRCMGVALTFDELDRRSSAIAAWLQTQGIATGDRVAIMLPNILHFPVVFFGALRAGATVVNVNPLYTPHELEFQLKDSGAKILFVLENFGHTVQTILEKVPTRCVVVCSLGEMFTPPKSWLVDFVVRHVKKLVHPYRLPRQRSLRFSQVLAQVGHRLV